MSRLKKFTAIWLMVLTIMSYLVLYYYSGYYNSKFVADWLALLGLSYMSASTTPVAYRAFRNGISTDRDKWIFSFWLIWTMALTHRLWVIFIALTGYQASPWYFTPVSGLFAVGFFLAACHGAIAPLSGEIPLNKKELVIFTFAAGFSGIIAGIAIGVFILAGWVN